MKPNRSKKVEALHRVINLRDSWTIVNREDVVGKNGSNIVRVNHNNTDFTLMERINRQAKYGQIEKG